MDATQTPGAAPQRGRLKVFLGYASGVGKTFRMLDEARRRKERGEDVVVVAWQPGAQAEVRTLLDKLETIPTLRTSLGEGLHMDAILRRRPEVAVIDPLAHNNPEGFPNAKRWQDVEALLHSGISVLTAVNLLHIEELRERVESLTGKRAKDTIPKAFLQRADEIVVVDVPAELALERAGENPSQFGGEQRQRALSELREMALVLAAEVVEGQLEQYLKANGIESRWGSHERILVCLTPRSDAAAMLASGQRNVQRFHGELHAVHVRQPRLSAEERARLSGFLKQAKEAGATVQVLEGEDAAAAILAYARAQRITQIFAGRTRRADWRRRFWPGTLGKLLRGAEQMDVRIFPH